MNVFITVMLIVNGCAFVFDFIFSLYLSFSKKIRQEKYYGSSRNFTTLLLLIPAMNEFATLKRDLPYLVKLHNQCKNFINLELVFIDDDSSDGTTELLDKWSHHANLHVIHRVKPNAQIGKGPALEYTVNQIIQMNYSLGKTLIGIIDADSHFDSDYLREVVATFQNSFYDLVQTRVDVYNTVDNLTIMQNFEFSIYNALLQMARTNWGSALASGNGQFVTLKMAKNVGWSSSLLEDCEFSLKGLLKGYYGTFLNTVSVKQEGVSNLNKLIRQRTRWCQGGLQCLRIYGGAIMKAKHLQTIVKTFIIFFLMVPYLSIIVVPSSIISVSVLIFYAFYRPLIGLAIIFTLLFTENLVNTLMIEKQWHESNLEPPKNRLKIFRIIFSFAFYRWVLAFIPYRAIIRQLKGNDSWVKTAHS
ncbi:MULTISPECIES: glycosyltransferase family 2 protein [Lactobacillus]|uniref:glycosyltransferase family 2 protein n=1 Tax=Lactobacillus TaxID=1578 RepID=UPI001C6A0137|nr:MULTISPECIES: glycosyltransferase family 2 protein [Lactobacillus]MCO6532237.1 glycosyltransferase family 2 protein [Lactobacillus sp.]QYN58049.1 glycosyltransferase family 2 protein [Lactobacillus panisapium]